jgi:hypothetical protein
MHLIICLIISLWEIVASTMLFLFDDGTDKLVLFSQNQPYFVYACLTTMCCVGILLYFCYAIASCGNNLSPELIKTLNLIARKKKLHEKLIAMFGKFCSLVFIMSTAIHGWIVIPIMYSILWVFTAVFVPAMVAIIREQLQNSGKKVSINEES